MTSYTLIPQPPEDVMRSAALFCVGGHNALLGDISLAPAKRPSCLLVFSALSGDCEVRTSATAFPVKGGGLLAVETESGALTAHAAHPADCAWALLCGTLPLDWLQSGERLPPEAHSPAEGMLRALRHTVELGGVLDGWWGSAQAYSLLMKLRAQAARAQSPAPPLVESAAALIRADFAYLGGVEDAADRLGVSKCHLIRCFTEHFGISPGKYLTQVRIEYAKQLLQGGRYGLETIAGMVGISGANYFCKLFKAHTGLTPGAYAALNPHAALISAEEPDQRFYL